MGVVNSCVFWASVSFTELHEMSAFATDMVGVNVVPVDQHQHHHHQHMNNNSSSSGVEPDGMLLGGQPQSATTEDHNMLDRITDDLNFLLSGTTDDMMTFSVAHPQQQEQQQGKQKLATIQENMVGISEEFDTRPVQ